MRRLIVNADDFGYTPGINRAIIEAHSSGIVTSTTLMANGPAFADACASLAHVPQLGLGCHIVLLDGTPACDSANVVSLLDPAPGVARFRTSLPGFAARAVCGLIEPRHIELETTAQIRRIQTAGLSPTHVDTHKHTHIFPKILRPVLRAARDCGIQAVRNPFRPSSPLPSTHLMKNPGIWRRWAELRVLSTLERTFRDTAARFGFATPDGTLGIEVTGALDHRLFSAIVQNIPEGTWELVCHPGYNDDDLARSRTRLKQSREIELRLLTLPEARQALEKTGVELISYRDLVP